VDLIEEYEDNKKSLSEGQIEKELKKAYRTKINFRGQNRLLKIEKSKSSNKYYVIVRDLKKKYDNAEVMKFFDNFESAKNLFQNLKEKYNGKDIRFLPTEREDIEWWAIVVIIWIAVIRLIISK
jgi:hypothetical protein